ncbi:MAG: hypothetical protein H0V07_05610 [Propionibacteriales bacterium]|nr:hypothetical protein [Propionibacteriales bacterium]
MEGRAIVRIAAVLVSMEALALFAFAVVDLVSINIDRVALGVTNAVFFGLYAVGLAVCARGLMSLRGWCRGPIVLAQIIQLGLAWSFAGAETAWLTVSLAVPAVVVLVAVLAPSTTQALYGSEIDDGRW